MIVPFVIREVHIHKHCGFTDKLLFSGSFFQSQAQCHHISLRQYCRPTQWVSNQNYTFCHPTELVLLVQVLELLVHLLSPILPLLACSCRAPRLTYQLSAQLVSEGRRNSCVKYPGSWKHSNMCRRSLVPGCWLTSAMRKRSCSINWN